jgi:tRNA A-37 threonylcarbamoyl transferase component Bud32
MRTWANSKILPAMGIQTARVVLACEYRKRGLLERGYVVMDYVDGQTLKDFLEPSVLPELREECIERVASLFNRLRENAVVHGDMKAKNLLVQKVDGGPLDLSLIDMDAMKLFLSRASFEKLFNKDRERFLRNWQSEPDLQKKFESKLPSIEQA